MNARTTGFAEMSGKGWVPKGLRVSGFWDATELGALGKTGLCSIGPLGFRVYRALEFRADRVFC